jgi:hypothetical protein
VLEGMLEVLGGILDGGIEGVLDGVIDGVLDEVIISVELIDVHLGKEFREKYLDIIGGTNVIKLAEGGSIKELP